MWRWGYGVHTVLPEVGRGSASTGHHASMADTMNLHTQHLLCSVLGALSYLRGGELRKDKSPPCTGPISPKHGFLWQQTCWNQGEPQSKGQKWKECSQVSPASPPGSLSWASWVFLLRRRTGFLLSVTVWKVALCQLCSPLSEEKASEQRHRKPAWVTLERPLSSTGLEWQLSLERQRYSGREMKRKAKKERSRGKPWVGEETGQSGPVGRNWAIAHFVQLIKVVLSFILQGRWVKRRLNPCPQTKIQIL